MTTMQHNNNNNGTIPMTDYSALFDNPEASLAIRRLAWWLPLALMVVTMARIVLTRWLFVPLGLKFLPHAFQADSLLIKLPPSSSNSKPQQQTRNNHHNNNRQSRARHAAADDDHDDGADHAEHNQPHSTSHSVRRRPQSSPMQRHRSKSARSRAASMTAVLNLLTVEQQHMHRASLSSLFMHPSAIDFTDPVKPADLARATQALGIQTEGSDLSEWARLLRRRQRMAQMQRKWIESSWRAFYYTVSAFVGLSILSSKQPFWLLNTEQSFWQGIPHEADADVSFYYVMSLAFYLHALIALFYETRKKDFMEMLVHHVATSILLFFSYLHGLSRFGCVVLIVHDIADPWLEYAKLANYHTRYKPVCMPTALFAVFVITFVGSRLFVLPVWCLRSVWYETTSHHAAPITLMAYKALLSTLFVLHLLWFSIIARMLWGMVTNRQGERRDARSDDEAGTEDDHNDNEAAEHSNNEEESSSDQAEEGHHPHRQLHHHVHHGQPRRYDDLEQDQEQQPGTGVGAGAVHVREQVRPPPLLRVDGDLLANDDGSDGHEFSSPLAPVSSSSSDVLSHSE